MKTVPIVHLLARRLSLMTLLALLFASLLAGAWAWNDERDSIEQRIEQIEAVFARPVGEAVWQVDAGQIEGLLDAIGTLEGVTQVRLSTFTGQQYALDRPLPKGTLLHRQIPLQYAGQPVGALEVTLGSNVLIARIAAHMAQVLVIVVIFIALSGVIFFLTVRRSLAQPLMRLAERMAACTPGISPQPIELEDGLGEATELRQLALSFNGMQDEIGRRLRDEKTLNAQIADLAAQRERRLSYIETLDNLLLGMSSSMISLPSAQIEPELKRRLAALAEHLRLDRISLMQIDEYRGTVQTDLLFANPQKAAAAPDPALLAEQLTRLGPWLRTRMASGACEVIEELGGPLQDPFGALATFRAEGLGAIVSVPLSSRDGSHGLLLFGVGTPHQWNEPELNGLKLTAQITAGALNQQRMFEQLAESRRHLEANNRMLERLSRTDALTGLGNRRAFDETREREFARAQRHSVPLSLILIDIDHFKAINDRLGHTEGDRYLRLLAGLLPTATKRAGEIAARIGGEEFALLLPGTDAAGAHALAEDLARRLAALALPHPGGTAPCLTVSMGIAQFDPRLHSTVDAWFADCDGALYAAKAAGRNRIETTAAVPATAH
jgi:diguanylate cyclase (GGDEF)-like protein